MSEAITGSPRALCKLPVQASRLLGPAGGVCQHRNFHCRDTHHFTSRSLFLPGRSFILINSQTSPFNIQPTNSFRMKFFAIIAIAFASVAVACKDDNIFCAPGMGACNDPAANCAKKRSPFTVARAILHTDTEAQINADTE
ncbi:hypothetical protein PMIN06_000214 [Paraphaeosphaeria minitans]